MFNENANQGTVDTIRTQTAAGWSFDSPQWTSATLIAEPELRVTGVKSSSRITPAVVPGGSSCFLERSLDQLEIATRLRDRSWMISPTQGKFRVCSAASLLTSK